MSIVRRASKHDPRLRWFDEARFGMFVHFGIYALLGRGEWVMYKENIPRAEYERLAGRFNPSRFDARRWVELARDAGARYITCTAKHHDGFCLFDSALTDYKITNTPFGRDLIGELVEACHAADMRICLYYSQPDWHHPNFVHKEGAFKDLQPPPPDQRPDWPRYREYVEGQVRELVTRYGRIDGIWFDGSHKSEREWGGRRLYQIIKLHQPGAVVNDRGRCGDFYTPERSLPDDLTGYLFEACQSVQAVHWGYMPSSPLHNVPHLVESLVRMAAAGGNYLLNVGPAPDGTIPPRQAERMRGVGRWLERNGEAVYRTRACRTGAEDEGVLATRRGNEVYLHLLRWPRTDAVSLPALRAAPEGAELLGADAPLKAEATEEGLSLSGLPAEPPGPHVNCVALHYDACPPIATHSETPAPSPLVEVDGPTVLKAEEADLRGRGVKGHPLRPAETPRGACADGWSAPEQHMRWRVRSERQRRVRVRVELACPEIYAGSRYAVRCGRSIAHGTVRGTTDFNEFKWQPAGAIDLPSGEGDVTVQARHLPYGYIFARIRSLELIPED